MLPVIGRTEGFHTRSEILRISDGKKVGTFPKGSESWHGDLHVQGNRVYVATNDGYVHKYKENQIIRLTVESPDAVSAVCETVVGALDPAGPTVMTDRLWAQGPDNVVDLLTGKKVQPLDARAVPGFGGPPSMAGTLMIGLNNGTREPEKRGKRLVASFNVVDMANPTCPMVLGDRNLLDSSEPPQDILLERYGQGLDRWRNACGANGSGSGGMAFWFGHRAGGPVAYGDRWYIQSTSFLWCIAPDVKGTASDDPKTVAAIRAAKSVDECAKWVGAESAQYNYEALRRIVSLKTAIPVAIAAKIKELASMDYHHEIRAAAIEALDACDPQQKPGLRFLLELMQKYPPERANIESWTVWGNREPEMRQVMITLRTLGAPYRDLILTECAKLADPKQKRTVLLYGSHLQWRSEAFVLAAIALGDAGILGPMAKDPRVKATLMKSWADGKATQEHLLAWPALSSQEKIELLFSNLGANWHGWNFWGAGLQMIQEMGAEAAPAIPKLEKLAAQADVKTNQERSDNIAKCIAAIQTASEPKK